MRLVDFGGSLGSSYFQNRHFLKGVDLKWVVIEQQHFVDIGRAEMEDDMLKFEYSLEDAAKKYDPNCLLLSSVLPYLENPFSWISKFCDCNFDYIIVDRNSFIKGDKTTLTVQTVPPDIYNASYPCWFFTETELINAFSKHYDVVAEFKDSFTAPTLVNNMRGYWKGFYFKRKANAK